MCAAAAGIPPAEAEALLTPIEWLLVTFYGTGKLKKPPTGVGHADPS